MKFQTVFNLVTIITRIAWSKELHTANPCLSAFQSKPEMGWLATIVFWSNCTSPTTPIFELPSSLYRFAGYSL